MAVELIVLAENVIDVAKRLTTDVTGLLRSIALLAAIAVVVFTYFKTRAWVPTLISIVMAGFVLWAVNNDDFLKDSTEKTIEQSRRPDVRALVEAHPSQQRVPPDAVRVAGGDDLEW